MSNSLRRRTRASTLWLVALLVSVWPLAVWHELTTMHAVCSEHGEVLDVALRAEGEPEDGPRLIDLDYDEHDPCAFASLAQPAGDGGGGPGVRIEALVGRGQAAWPAFVRAPAYPRYLLAPKQSPPRGSAS